jgi:hypothetical protein
LLFLNDIEAPPVLELFLAASHDGRSDRRRTIVLVIHIYRMAVQKVWIISHRARLCTAAVIWHKEWKVGGQPPGSSQAKFSARFISPER